MNRINQLKSTITKLNAWCSAETTTILLHRWRRRQSLLYTTNHGRRRTPGYKPGNLQLPICHKHPSKFEQQRPIEPPNLLWFRSSPLLRVSTWRCIQTLSGMSHFSAGLCVCPRHGGMSLYILNDRSSLFIQYYFVSDPIVNYLYVQSLPPVHVGIMPRSKL